MNSTRVWFFLVLLFLLAALSYAQQPGRQSDPGNQQEETAHPSEVSPPPRSPEMKPPRQREEPQPQREQKPPKAQKQEAPKPPNNQAKPNREEPNPVGGERKAAKVNGKSARIPARQFQANFGRQHTFTLNRVITETPIVPRQTQFVFAGYTFVFLDPWPEEWLPTDDCYIEFVDDEYFLFDAFHPGIRVALFVVG